MNVLQLQRCIDGELNDADRTEFLKKLEQQNDTTAWRALALGFVEDQIFRSALTDEVLTDISSISQPRKQDRLPARKQSFSVMSVLTLCLGIAAGVLLMQSVSEHDAVELVQASGQEREHVLQGEDTENDQQKQSTVVQNPEPAMYLEWKTNEDQSISLPVFSQEQYANANRLQQSKLFPEHLQKELEMRGFKVHRQPRIYRVPLDDGRQILVPTESVQVRHAVY